MRNNPLRVFTRYDEESSSEETNHFLSHCAWILVSRMEDTPYRVKLDMLLRAQDLLNLCKCELPYDRLTVQDAAIGAQVIAFFSKRADLDLGVDKVAVATEKFIAAEQRCAETNTILKLRRRGLISLRPRVEAVLFAAQRKIARILGDVPTLSALQPRFGAGANTTIKKADSCPRNKLGAPVSASSELAPFIPELLREMPGWQKVPSGDLLFICGAEVRVTQVYRALDMPIGVDVGIVEFVPKSWKTHRAIVKEPMLNTMWQLGIGDYLTERLRLGGCDLKDGQTFNRSAARIGSLTGELATLDLSSASDTIASELVADLLPVDWYDFLRKFRTGTVRINELDLDIRQEKFSSMGNGFTFPLETLLFYAIAKSVSDEAYVYGDDIIVKTDAVELLKEVLDACGFLINTEKSFVSGPFRESCGGDYLSGIDIRPVFVKDRLSAADIFVIHNHYVDRFDDELTCLLRARLHKSLQLEGPRGYGDGYLHTWSPNLRAKRPQSDPFGEFTGDRGWGGYCFDTFVETSKESVRISQGDYVLPSYSIYVSSREGGDVEPRLRSGYLRKKDRVRIPASLLQRGVAGGDLPTLSCVEAPPLSVKYGKDGTMRVILPGSVGYKRMTIYLAHHP